MGLLDNFSLDNLDDPKNAGLLAMGLSMLAPKPYKTSLLGDIGSSGMQGLQTLAVAKQQERQNRASDLQQLQGVYSILQNNEAMRWAAAKQSGQQYTPSPEYLAVQAKIAKMSGLNTLSSPGTPAPSVTSPLPPTNQTMPPPVPGLAPPSQSPMSNPGYQPVPGMVRPNSATPAPAYAPPPQAPAQSSAQGSGFGAPAGGLDMTDFMMAANNPGLKMYVDQYAKDHSVQNVRQGGYILDANRNPVFYAAKLDSGIQPTFGQNGQVTAASAIPGYAGATSEIKGAESAAGQRGKQAETYVDVPIGHNQTLRMTNAQYEASRNRGLPPPTIPPEVLAAAAGGQPFNATQAPGGNVQFQPPSASQLSGIQPSPLGGSMGGLGITASPAAMAGATAEAEAAAKNRQKVMTDDYQGLANQSATAQTVISRLQTIKQLGPQAITGAETDVRDFLNGILALGNYKPAQNAKEASDLLDKQAANIAIAIGAGSNGTDALRTLAQIANPNRHMQNTAIPKAADSVIAPLEMSLAKIHMQTPSFVRGDASTYLNQKQKFEQSADPRLWELQSLPPEDQKAYVSGLTPQDAKNLLQKRAALKQLGVLQ